MIVAKNATKQIFLEELSRLENKIDSNDSLLIFRTGHGAIDLVFESNKALPRIKLHLPLIDLKVLALQQL